MLFASTLTPSRWPLRARARALDEQGDLRATLTTLPPDARDRLHPVVIGNQPERDAVAAAPLRYPAGSDLAVTIDLLTLNPDIRR